MFRSIGWGARAALACASLTALPATAGLDTDALFELSLEERIDMEALQAIPDPDRGSLFDVALDEYQASARQLLTRLEVAARIEDMDELIIASHSLKSASGQLGARRLMTLCARVEKLGRSGDAHAFVLAAEVPGEVELALEMLDSHRVAPAQAWAVPAAAAHRAWRRCPRHDGGPSGMESPHAHENPARSLARRAIARCPGRAGGR